MATRVTIPVVDLGVHHEATGYLGIPMLLPESGRLDETQ